MTETRSDVWTRTTLTGTESMWNRRINGRLYRFTYVVMRNGERRWFVRRAEEKTMQVYDQSYQYLTGAAEQVHRIIVKAPCGHEAYEYDYVQNICDPCTTAVAVAEDAQYWTWRYSHTEDDHDHGDTEQDAIDCDIETAGIARDETRTRAWVGAHLRCCKGYREAIVHDHEDADAINVVRRLDPTFAS